VGVGAKSTRFRPGPYSLAKILCVLKRTPRGLGPNFIGRSKYWIKVRNRKHPAMNRVFDPEGNAK
jgi:hypothetical protein